MGIRALAPPSIIALILVSSANSQQSANSPNLAKSLCDIDQLRRERAINMVTRSPDRYLPLLLEWTRNPPPGIGLGSTNFDVSLAEIFGRLRTTEAVPFLIDHITVVGGASASIWNRRIEIIEKNLPAIHALVEIGSPATPPLVAALDRMPYRSGGPAYEQRFAIVVALALMKDPQAAPALRKELARPTRERRLAHDALEEMGLLPRQN